MKEDKRTKQSLVVTHSKTTYIRIVKIPALWCTFNSSPKWRYWMDGSANQNSAEHKKYFGGLRLIGWQKIVEWSTFEICNKILGSLRLLMIHVTWRMCDWCDGDGRWEMGELRMGEPRIGRGWVARAWLGFGVVWCGMWECVWDCVFSLVRVGMKGNRRGCFVLGSWVRSCNRKNVRFLFDVFDARKCWGTLEPSILYIYMVTIAFCYCILLFEFMCMYAYKLRKSLDMFRICLGLLESKICFLKTYNSY